MRWTHLLGRSVCAKQDPYQLKKAPVMELVDMRVLGTRAFGVSVRVRPGAMGVMTMLATSVDLKIPSHNALFLALFPPPLRGRDESSSPSGKRQFLLPKREETIPLLFSPLVIAFGFGKAYTFGFFTKGEKPIRKRRAPAPLREQRIPSSKDR